MKKYFLLALVLLTVVAANAQLPTITNKSQPAKFRKPDSLVVSTNSALAVIEKLPDLTIYNLRATYQENVVLGGITRNHVLVEYSIENKGRVAVNMRNVFLKGSIQDTAAGNVPLPAGGWVLSEINGKMLNPGEKISGVFAVTSKIINGHRYNYILQVDSEGFIKESNETNNTKLILVN